MVLSEITRHRKKTQKEFPDQVRNAFDLESNIIQKYGKHSRNIHPLSGIKGRFGINPRSSFDTPIGIYGYPLDNPTIVAGLLSNTLPFGQDRPWMYVFRFKDPSKVLNLSKLIPQSVVDALLKIKPLESIKGVVRQKMIQIGDYEDVMKEDIPRRLQDPRLFFYVTNDLSNYRPSDWSALLRKIGLHGVVDYGVGIIYDAEPIQGFALSKEYIELLDEIPNPHAPKPDKTLVRGKKVSKLKREATFQDWFNRLVKRVFEPGSSVAKQQSVLADVLGEIDKVVLANPNVPSSLIGKFLERIYFIDNSLLDLEGVYNKTDIKSAFQHEVSGWFHDGEVYRAVVDGSIVGLERLLRTKINDNAHLATIRGMKARNKQFGPDDPVTKEMQQMLNNKVWW